MRRKPSAMTLEGAQDVRRITMHYPDCDIVLEMGAEDYTVSRSEDADGVYSFDFEKAKVTILPATKAKAEQWQEVLDDLTASRMPSD